MNNKRFWFILSAIFLAGLFISWLCFILFPESPFRDNFLGNLLATILGVILGIPVALWINLVQEKTSEKERKQKILKLLYSELFVNFTVLSGWDKSEDKKGEARILSAVLRNESWKAFSDGGELEWIKDPDLLDSISEAYFMIRSVSEMSDKYFSLLMVNWEETSLLIMHNHYSYLQKSVNESVGTISHALREIENQTK